jgi:hypothetical protein
MRETGRPGLDWLKGQLYGPLMSEVLADRGVTKYRLARDTGITYQTLWNWQTRRAWPSDDLALRVGMYLGLMGRPELQAAELQDRVAQLQADIKRLGGGAPAPKPPKAKEV